MPDLARSTARIFVREATFVFNRSQRFRQTPARREDTGAIRGARPPRPRPSLRHPACVVESLREYQSIAPPSPNKRPRFWAGPFIGWWRRGLSNSTAKALNRRGFGSGVFRTYAQTYAYACATLGFSCLVGIALHVAGQSPDTVGDIALHIASATGKPGTLGIVVYRCTRRDFTRACWPLA